MFVCLFVAVVVSRSLLIRIVIFIIIIITTRNIVERFLKKNLKNDERCKTTNYDEGRERRGRNGGKVEGKMLKREEEKKVPNATSLLIKK